MKYVSVPRSRLVLAGFFLFVLGCDAVLGIEATPYVGDRDAGIVRGEAGLVGDGAASAEGMEGSAPGEAGVMPSEAGVTAGDASGGTTPDATVADSQSDAPISSAPPVSLQDCVLLMHMDEATWSGTGAVIDSSGQGNNGTLVGTGTQTVPNGKFGRAAQFSGSGFIGIPDAPSLNPTTAVTYAAWIYPTGFTSDSMYPGIVTKRNAYGVDSAFAMFLWTYNRLFADIENDRSYSAATIVNNQGWYHVAVVYDGALADATHGVSLYINGVLDSTSTAGASMSPHAEQLDIGYLSQGSLDPDPNAFFIGLIDEVAIWKRALSATEIAGLYSATGPL